MHLVGAGPGNPALVTLAARQLLARCDAVVYDHLIPFELIVTLPSSVEKHYVGKQAGKQGLSQEFVNNLLAKLAAEGKRVVRLKGGDPFVFGRGGEEAAFLRKHQIPFEIVPGITAGIAASAFAGIPCTDRTKASYVIFATGHRADEDSRGVPWDLLAKARDGTIVIYMGVAEARGIVNKLIEHGLPKEMPSAIIEHGTLPTQRVVTASLSSLPEKIQEMDIKPPAVMVIGNVVERRDQLAWFGTGPLSGIRLMVTRPADQASEIYSGLADLGGEVLPYPTIATEENVDRKGWKAVSEIYDLASDTPKWLVFTSENGLRYFMEQFKTNIGDVRKLSAFKIAAIGHGTSKALGTLGIVVDFVPSRATTAALASEMTAKLDLGGANVVRIRGNLGDDGIERALGSAGANVIRLQVYRTFYPTWPDGLIENLFEYPPHVIIFTSGSTVDGFFKMLGLDLATKLTRSAAIATIGPATSAVARSRGLEVGIEAREHSIPGLVSEVAEYFTKRNQHGFSDTSREKT